MTLDEKLLLLRGFNGGFIGGRSKDPMIGPVQRMTSAMFQACRGSTYRR